MMKFDNEEFLLLGFAFACLMFALVVSGAFFTFTMRPKKSVVSIVKTQSQERFFRRLCEKKGGEPIKIVKCVKELGAVK